MSGPPRARFAGTNESLCASHHSNVHSALPKTTEAQILDKRVLRSGTSIGANYREAFRGRTRAEFIAKCGDCLREIEETAYWLELLVESGMVSADKLSPLRDEIDQLTAIFVTILKRSKDVPSLS